MAIHARRPRDPGSAMAVDDAGAVEVVGGQLHPYAVAGQDPDPEAAHLARHVPEQVWPLSSWTRNMAFGSASTTSPSNSTLSSLAMRGAPYRQRPGPPGPNVRRLATDAAVGDRGDRGEIRAGVSGSG